MNHEMVQNSAPVSQGQGHERIISRKGVLGFCDPAQLAVGIFDGLGREAEGANLSLGEGGMNGLPPSRKAHP
ncbi:MAG: hypothetical protein RR135_01950 [Oscillospiraceae bacterium]